LAVILPIEKYCELQLYCTQEKINNGISATAATRCHIYFFRMKICPHCLRCCLLSKLV